MDRTLPDPLLAQYSEFVADRMGLHFPRERWGDLEQATARAAGDLGCVDARACVQQLLSRAVSKRQLEILASHLTVGETYFFRDQAAFDCLERLVLPELIASRQAGERRLRIWSAGCSTGEEPYSIAILLVRLIRDLRAWNISILATDINPVVLQKAARGVYNDWSFRDTLPGLKEGFFARTGGGQLAIADRIKAMVTFGYLNLVEDIYPSVGNSTNAMDIIFCRNVLMYFEAARSRQLIGRLGLSLMEGGWLFVSPVETPQVVWPRLVEVKFPGAIVYRKESTSTAADRALEAAPWTTALPALEDPAAGEESEPYAWPEPPGSHESVPGEVRSASAHTLEAEAATLYGQGHYAEAAAKLREVLERSPDDAVAMALLARSYANQGRLADAAQWCKEATKAEKLNPRWCYLLATILQEQGELDAAVAALRRALYLDQGSALAHFELGTLTRRKGKPKDADRHFRNALSILDRCGHDALLPESEGITAGRLAEIIRSTVLSEAET
jgi:chemotaxis protein methyltransferase CheR